MRFPFLALSLAVLAGCAGNVADHIGPRAPIIAPQLGRYGLDQTATQCIGLRLGNSLTPLQLRRFERHASVVRESFYSEAGLTLRDLVHVASQMPDPAISAELGNAIEQCGAVAPQSAVEGQDPVAEPTPQPSPQGPTWLNLGAASTGQAIAVDATSLRQEGTMRTAWFRLTNPGASTSTGITYLLRIDCSARTISPQADRRQDSEGRIVESRDYGPEEQGPLPIDAGTVMEIAFLSLCT